MLFFSSRLFEVICSFIHPTTAGSTITYVHDLQYYSHSRASFLYVHVIEAVSKWGTLIVRSKDGDNILKVSEL